MKNYRQFDVMDFVQDEAFGRWAEGRASATEETFWRQWLLENKDKRETIGQATLTVRALRVKEVPLPAETLRHEVQRILSAVQQEPVVRPLPQPRRLWWLAAAASVLLIGISGWLFTQVQPLERAVATDRTYETTVAEASVPLLERRNSTNKPLTITLADRSVVRLEPGGRLSYPAQFAPDSRTVYLSGNAFFEVTRNPRQPFLVFANETVTKVLGTSFRVNAQPQDRRVTVQVRTGLVAVMPKKSFSTAELGTLKTENGVLLTPNQQAVFEREAEKLSRTLVETPQLLTQKAEPARMNFEDTPLVDVLDALERAYGIDIVYDAASLQRCTLRAALFDEPLFDKLDLICKTVGLSYQVIDTQIVVTGRGCGQ